MRLLSFIFFATAVSVPAAAAAAGKPTATAEFLEWFWDRPLAPQSALPAGFPAAPAGLEPETCGTCHVTQLEGWRGSRHSLAMDPGVLGQLVEMGPDARDDHQACLRCHAPLAEQADALSAAIAALRGPSLGRVPSGLPPLTRESPQYVPDALFNRSGTRATASASGLHDHGMICAACHVREGRWYGPPRRDGSSPQGDLSAFPHRGFTASPAFEDSRFCAACHQFDENGYALKGKMLENTYEEWRASRHAREGRSCQSCHMPDRQHLWRGIHDPATVKQAVDIRADTPQLSSDTVSGRLTIKNAGAGHDFPTYVTPRVIAEAFQVDDGGHAIAGTLQTYVIARQVPLDLSREIADTRIAPDRTAALDYHRPRADGARALVYRVRVEPDAYYTGLFTALLEGSLKPAARALIAQARDDSLKSHFTVYEQRMALPDR